MCSSVQKFKVGKCTILALVIPVTVQKSWPEQMRWNINRLNLRESLQFGQLSSMQVSFNYDSSQMYDSSVVHSSCSGKEKKACNIDNSKVK